MSVRNNCYADPSISVSHVSSATLRPKHKHNDEAPKLEQETSPIEKRGKRSKIKDEPTDDDCDGHLTKGLATDNLPTNTTCPTSSPPTCPNVEGNGEDVTLQSTVRKVVHD